MKELITLASGVVIVFGLLWLGMGNQFFLYKVFAPRVEQVRRETFEQTKSYRQGTIQELENLQREYLTADTEHRAALRSIILRRATNVPETELPTHLRAFVQKVRNEQ